MGAFRWTKWAAEVLKLAPEKMTLKGERYLEVRGLAGPEEQLRDKYTAALPFALPGILDTGTQDHHFPRGNNNKTQEFPSIGQTVGASLRQDGLLPSAAFWPQCPASLYGTGETLHKNMI